MGNIQALFFYRSSINVHSIPDFLRDPPVPAAVRLELAIAVAHAADPSIPRVVVDLVDIYIQLVYDFYLLIVY